MSEPMPLIASLRRHPVLNRGSEPQICFFPSFYARALESDLLDKSDLLNSASSLLILSPQSHFHGRHFLEVQIALRERELDAVLLE